MEARVSHNLEEVQWKDSYSVGVSEIDIQHMQLFSLANKVIKAMETNAEVKEVGLILDELFEYIEMHFSTEEAYTSVCNNFEEHKRAHVKFISSIQMLVQQYLSGDVNTLPSLLDFLISWLKDHIMGTDQKAFTWLRENNLLWCFLSLTWWVSPTRFFVKKNSAILLSSSYCIYFIYLSFLYFLRE